MLPEALARLGCQAVECRMCPPPRPTSPRKNPAARSEGLEPGSGPSPCRLCRNPPTFFPYWLLPLKPGALGKGSRAHCPLPVASRQESSSLLAALTPDAGLLAAFVA